MSTDVQHAVLLQRPVFKMNPATEFWAQQRGSNHMPLTDNPPSPSNDSLLNNNNNNSQCTSLNNNGTPTNHMTDAAMANNISSTSSGDPNQDQVMALTSQLPPEVHSTSPAPEPMNHSTENALASVSNALGGLTDPKLMTEKLVSELQNRSNSVISDRTLEECWTTLQRIFMHKSAMQMQMQRAGSVGASSSISGGGLESNKPHQCQQCLKSFSSNHQLVQHIRVHTGEKPYKCTYCERRFKQLSHVQQHTRLHTGERPYRCHLTECGRAFIQLSNLQQHLRNHDAQLERAKSRPFHCNICGKGFATESSLRTHTSKAQWNHGLNHVRVSCGTQEVELRTDMLQQHAAFIGAGTNAATCPLCHKFFLGGEALVEHMKLHHKDPPSGVTTPTSEISSGMAPSSYLAKRRTANHPCPVCGKHYVNEGSLRKHMACHPETAQLATTLRMWPCSVCQAVFTHESGLLSHMEHMRMDPKHQFAAQYVLSRAAAERRERENILASAALGLPLGLGANPSQCESPSGHSDSSSQNGERLSSAGSDPGNFNNNNNNITAAKLAELMAGRAVANNGYYLQQGHQYNANDLQRAATALIQQQAQVVAAAQAQQAQNQQAAGGAGSQQLSGNPQAQNCSNLPNPESPSAANAATAAVQVAAANLAAAMRMSQQTHQANAVNSLQSNSNQNNQRPWKKENMDDGHSMNGASMGNSSPDMSAVQLAAMNAAMRASMSSMVDQSQSLLQQQQANTSPTLRMQEAFLRSQAEALRLAVSQAVAASTTQQSDTSSLRQHSIATTIANTQNFNHQGQVSPDLTEALRLQEQRLEQALRLHGDPRALGFSLPNHQHP